MQKINEEMLSFFINKYLGCMTKDAQKDVEVTDQGFVYKGELIVSLPGLRDKIVEKEKVTVGELSKKKPETKVFEIDTGNIPKEKAEAILKETIKKFDPRKVDVVLETPVAEEVTTEEPKVDEPVVEEPKPTHTYPGKKRGPKPKNKSQ